MLDGGGSAVPADAAGAAGFGSPASASVPAEAAGAAGLVAGTAGPAVAETAGPAEFKNRNVCVREPAF